jgi:hypothetical protein
LQDLWPFIRFRSVVGSRAYGLERPDSDTDRRGFYLPPADQHWSLESVPEQLESSAEECYWELGKFVRLALKANPTVLECLYSPIVETCLPPADALLAIRDRFLSKRAHQTYGAYVDSQFAKIQRDLRIQGEIRWKHVMHLMRLLLSGITVLREGRVSLHAGPHVHQLRAIREGVVPWDQVDAWRVELAIQLDQAAAASTLPEQPDMARANQFLINARRYAASSEYGRLP